MDDLDRNVTRLQAEAFSLEKAAKAQTDPKQRSRLDLAAGYVFLAIQELGGRLEFQADEEEIPAKKENGQMDEFDDDAFDEEETGDIFDESDDYEFDSEGGGGSLFEEGGGDDDEDDFDEETDDLFDEDFDEDEDDEGDIAVGV